MDLSWASMPPASDPALAEHPDGSALVAEAEECMRGSGLWPWPGSGIDLGARACVAQAVTGEVHTVPWDYLVLFPGLVTRTFGTPGGEQEGRGTKTLAQATHLHDHVLAELELGNAVGDEPGRAAHRTFVVAGAGYAGVETAATPHLFTRRLLPRFISLRPEHLHWALADVAPHVLPELGGSLSAAALGRLRQRRIDVRPGTGQPPQPCRHRGLGLAVDLGGTQAVGRPLGRHVTGIPVQMVTRGYHLYALPSARARVRAAADWLVHVTLSDDFTRPVLPDAMSGTLAGQQATGSTCPPTTPGRQRSGSSPATRQGG
jgi:NADH dehydrogenase FAD-containing subunit